MLRTYSTEEFDDFSRIAQKVVNATRLQWFYSRGCFGLGFLFARHDEGRGLKVAVVSEVFGAHTRTCIYIYIYIYIYTHIYIHICICTCLHTYIHTYIHIHIYTNIHTCLHVQAHILTDVQTCRHTGIQTYRHTCAGRSILHMFKGKTDR